MYINYRITENMSWLRKKADNSWETDVCFLSKRWDFIMKANNIKMTVKTLEFFEKNVFYFILNLKFKLFSLDNLTTCIYVTRYWSRYQNSSFMLSLNIIYCVLTFNNIQCTFHIDAMSIVVLLHHASIPMLYKSHAPISLIKKRTLRWKIDCSDMHIHVTWYISIVLYWISYF